MIPAGNPATAGTRTLAALDPLSYFNHHTAALTPRQRDLVRASVFGACAAMADGAGVLDAESWRSAVDEAVERWGAL